MRPDPIKILAVGDIFLADAPLKLGRGVRSRILKSGPDYFINRVKTITNGFDVCFGNLESVLSNCGRNRLLVSSIEIRGEAKSVDILSQSGFNVVNVANNHIFQHGLDAYTDTVNRLIENGIKVVGDDSIQPGLAVIEKGTIRLGFIGYSTHYEQYRPDERCPYSLRDNFDEILDEIRQIRTSFDGYLICSLHWGFEFLPAISVEQREFCYLLVDNGVNLVLGHHPHVPQAVEKYNNATIAYSLGNFIFDMDFEEAKQSFALAITVGSEGRIDSEVIPFEIRDDCCPYLLSGSEKISFLEKLARLTMAAELGECQTDSKLKALEKETYWKISQQTYSEFFENIFKINPWYSASLIIRALLRRAGLIHNP